MSFARRKPIGISLKNPGRHGLLPLLLLLVPTLLWADDEADARQELNATSLGSLDSEQDSNEPPPRKLGIELATPSGRFTIHPWLRLQTRYSDPFDSDPRTPDAFSNSPGSEIEVRRARLKVDAELGRPEFTLYFEHELSGDAPLLDLRVDIEFPRGWKTRIGQYKVLYNRERVDSSGKQTFVERSISTYAFTLDRQRGITVSKLWAPDTPANQQLFFGVFEGDGREPGPRGDREMFMARWQWQFLGRALPFTQSDLEFLDKPAASFSLGASTVTGPYTRFSSSGGGQLDGFEQSGNDRYKLDQWLQEFAWKYRGFAVQQELHVKRIKDRELGNDSTLRGGYLQFGKTWRTPWLGDSPMELALRYAQVDWDNTPADRDQRELTVGGNLFFDGHNNKLTMDISRLWLDYASAGDNADTRLRLQWDISF